MTLTPPVAGGAPPPGERGWLMVVHTQDRPGALSALSAVFSSRGVNFDSLATGAVDGSVGSIALSFRTTARRARLLDRAVERLATVRAVTTRHDDDPAVLAAGVVSRATLDGRRQGPTAQAESPTDAAGGDAAGGGAAGGGAATAEWAEAGGPAGQDDSLFVVHGDFAAVTQAVSTARRGGCAGGGIVILALSEPGATPA